MGLDQSFFTNNKALAQAIYEGNVPENKWSEACFSPNFDPKPFDDEGLTRFDVYTKNRLAQQGQGSCDLFVVGDERYLYIPYGRTDEDHKNTLRVMESYGAPNGVDIAGETFYQIGLFRKHNALHGWVDRHFRPAYPQGIPNDAQVGFHPSLLSALRYDCQRVLDAFAKSQHKGEKIAKRVFPTTQGLFFGGYDYDDEYVSQIEELLDFIDVVFSVPESSDDEILITYNPWW